MPELWEMAATELAALRVSVITDTGGDPTDQAVTAAVRQAAALLADAGYVVQDDEPPAVERAAEIYYQIMAGYGRAAERLPPVESVAPGEFARFWQAFERPGRPPRESARSTR